MEIAKGSIGPEASYDLELKDGGVSIVITYVGADAKAKLEASLSVDVFIDKLKKLIPGTIDDAILDGLKAALK